MIAVQFVSSQRFRVLAPETPTVDPPEDFERRGGWALEMDGKLDYLTRAGDQASMPLSPKRLAFRKPGDLCLIRSDELAPDGRPLWTLAKVERRL